MTDEHAAYKSLKKMGYDHRTVNLGEGGYASAGATKSIRITANAG